MNTQVAAHNAAILATIAALEAQIEAFALAADTNNSDGWEYVDGAMLREMKSDLERLKEYTSVR